MLGLGRAHRLLPRPFFLQVCAESRPRCACACTGNCPLRFRIADAHASPPTDWMKPFDDEPGPGQIDRSTPLVLGPLRPIRRVAVLVAIRLVESTCQTGTAGRVFSGQPRWPGDLHFRRGTSQRSANSPSEPSCRVEVCLLSFEILARSRPPPPHSTPPRMRPPLSWGREGDPLHNLCESKVNLPSAQSQAVDF